MKNQNMKRKNALGKVQPFWNKWTKTVTGYDVSHIQFKSAKILKEWFMDNPDQILKDWDVEKWPRSAQNLIKAIRSAQKNAQERDGGLSAYLPGSPTGKLGLEPKPLILEIIILPFNYFP